jgi:2'-5' RNA ligase
MTRIRAFVALNLPVELIRETAPLQARLRDAAKTAGMRVGWVPAANMHVTLKFLGEIPEELAPAVGEVLAKNLAGRAALPVTVKGAGVFPEGLRPRVVWIGVHSEGDALSALAADVETWLADLGLPRESRPFHAHLTVGRVKEGTGDLVTGLEEQLVGECVAEEVVLYRSVLQRSGAEYTALRRVRLGSRASK